MHRIAAYCGLCCLENETGFGCTAYGQEVFIISITNYNHREIPTFVHAQTKLQAQYEALRTIFLDLLSTNISCNIRTVFGSSAFQMAGYCFRVCVERIFEGGPSASPDFVFILQQVSQMYHFLLSFNLLEWSCSLANPLALEHIYSIGLPNSTLCSTAHLVGWTCGITQYFAVDPFVTVG